FCLRARLAGFRLSIVPSVFVHHDGSKTFEANGLNFTESLARNQRIFHERASRWSRSLAPPVASSIKVDSLSVILPVLPATLPGLSDSLISLCNQTVSNFETVIVHTEDVGISEYITAFSGRLKITVKTSSGGLAALLNAGLFAFNSRRIAYLMAGDVFYPFHL